MRLVVVAVVLCVFVFAAVIAAPRVAIAAESGAVDASVSAAVDRAASQLKDFDDLYQKCLDKQIPLDYPTVTKTMLEEFIPLAQHDAQKGIAWRAKFAAQDLQQALNDGMAELRAYLNDPTLAPNVPRYQTGKVEISGTSFIADRKDSRGSKSRGPVFFTGYGHFAQVRRDLDRWPGYGVNIIQQEIGPKEVLTSEKQVNLLPAKSLAAVLDRAAANNVKVDVLLSPHYFPDWALRKWPDLSKGGGGYLHYCVDAPEAKQVIEKFLRTVVPMFKDKPALNSFCLSNEPMFNNSANCPNTKPMWTAYLAKIHGDVKTMNDRYGTKYASFDDVPIPANDAYTAPQFYDWAVFNQERFAAWHRWMADIIHEMAPDVPVHAKVTSNALGSRKAIAWGLDPELFAKLSQINGNDGVIAGRPSAGWALPWRTQNKSYDLQRSLALKPIFNSENHITFDGADYYVPPEHFRTALWQGAIHGQSATAIWVWERSDNPKSSFYGNVMDRPGCVEAVGRTALDLDRFADEVTALQNVHAPVAIIFSIASIARNDQYLSSVDRAYTALNFCGVKVDFISEKQLAAGKGADYKMIVLPQATNVPADTYEAVRNLPASTKIIILGNSLEMDPYNRPYPANELSQIRKRAVLLDAVPDPQSIWPRLLPELSAVGALPEVSVVDAGRGRPVWGIEWLPATVNGRTVISMVNLLDNKPVDVKIQYRGKQVDAVDMLSLGGREKVRTLTPMKPVLADISIK